MSMRSYTISYTIDSSGRRIITERVQVEAQALPGLDHRKTIRTL